MSSAVLNIVTGKIYCLDPDLDWDVLEKTCKHFKQKQADCREFSWCRIDGEDSLRVGFSDDEKQAADPALRAPRHEMIMKAFSTRAKFVTWANAQAAEIAAKKRVPAEERRKFLENHIAEALNKPHHYISPAALFCRACWMKMDWSNNNTPRQVAGRLVSLAIHARLEWHEDDFIEMVSFLHPEEGHYAAALGDNFGSDSKSFVKAFEKWAKRTPFLFAWETATRQRLYVGARFWWKGFLPTVTSFADGGKQQLNCVVYRDGTCENEAGRKLPEKGMQIHLCGDYRTILDAQANVDEWTLKLDPKPAEHLSGTAKIERRFQITPDDLKEAERLSKSKLAEWIDIKKQPGGIDKLNKIMKEIKSTLTPIDMAALVAATSDKEEED